jgi:hypothetical protein
MNMFGTHEKDARLRTDRLQRLGYIRAKDEAGSHNSKVYALIAGADSSAECAGLPTPDEIEASCGVGNAAAVDWHDLDASLQELLTRNGEPG